MRILPRRFVNGVMAQGALLCVCVRLALAISRMDGFTSNDNVLL